MKLTCYSLAGIVLFSTLAPLQAETWSGKRTAYRMPGGKWTKARIDVSPGAVEVFNRNDVTVVARFEKGNVALKGGRISGTGVQRKTSISRGTVAGITTGFGGLLAVSGIGYYVKEAREHADMYDSSPDERARRLPSPLSELPLLSPVLLCFAGQEKAARTSNLQMGSKRSNSGRARMRMCFETTSELH